MEMFPENSQKFQIFLNHSLIVLEHSNAFYAFYTHTRHTTYQIFLPLFIILLWLIIINISKNIYDIYGKTKLIKFRGM